MLHLSRPPEHWGGAQGPRGEAEVMPCLWVHSHLDCCCQDGVLLVNIVHAAVQDMSFWGSGCDSLNRACASRV